MAYNLTAHTEDLFEDVETFDSIPEFLAYVHESEPLEDDADEWILVNEDSGNAISAKSLDELAEQCYGPWEPID